MNSNIRAVRLQASAAINAIAPETSIESFYSIESQLSVLSTASTEGSVQWRTADAGDEVTSCMLYGMGSLHFPQSPLRFQKKVGSPPSYSKSDQSAGERPNGIGYTPSLPLHCPLSPVVVHTKRGKKKLGVEIQTPPKRPKKLFHEVDHVGKTRTALPELPNRLQTRARKMAHLRVEHAPPDKWCGWGDIRDEHVSSVRRGLRKGVRSTQFKDSNAAEPALAFRRTSQSPTHRRLKHYRIPAFRASDSEDRMLSPPKPMMPTVEYETTLDQVKSKSHRDKSMRSRRYARLGLKGARLWATITRIKVMKNEKKKNLADMLLEWKDKFLDPMSILFFDGHKIYKCYLDALRPLMSESQLSEIVTLYLTHCDKLIQDITFSEFRDLFMDNMIEPCVPGMLSRIFTMFCRGMSRDTLTFGEFGKGMSLFMDTSLEGRLKLLFHVVDEDCSGCIELSELIDLFSLSTLDGAGVSAMAMLTINVLDEDRSGNISPEELLLLGEEVPIIAEAFCNFLPQLQQYPYSGGDYDLTFGDLMAVVRFLDGIQEIDVVMFQALMSRFFGIEEKHLCAYLFQRMDEDCGGTVSARELLTGLSDLARNRTDVVRYDFRKIQLMCKMIRQGGNSQAIDKETFFWCVEEALRVADSAVINVLYQDLQPDDYGDIKIRNILEFFCVRGKLSFLSKTDSGSYIDEIATL
eukprot:Rmarinus@m.16768